MIGFFSGLLVFLLFVLYDLGQANLLPNIWSRLVRSFFLLGFTILAGCTAVLVWAQGLQILLWHSINFGFLLCAFLFLGLLIYTLFFALPFEETYCEENKLRAAYTEGVYGLCRHPGVLWFAGAYLCMWGMFGGWRPGIYFLLMIFWNYLYIIFQDLWTFPQTFFNYREYQKTTPFLMPNRDSIKKCLYSIRKQ